MIVSLAVETVLTIKFVCSDAHSVANALLKAQMIEV